jgi:hypothetical protein
MRWQIAYSWVTGFLWHSLIGYICILFYLRGQTQMANITLSPRLSELVEKAAAMRGLDAETYATTLIEASLSAEAREFEEACAGIARGLAQAQAGQLIPWEELKEERAAAREARRKVRDAQGVSEGEKAA